MGKAHDARCFVGKWKPIMINLQLKWFCLYALFNFHRLTKNQIALRNFHNNAPIVAVVVDISCITICDFNKANINTNKNREEKKPNNTNTHSLTHTPKSNATKWFRCFFSCHFQVVFMFPIYCSLVSLGFQISKTWLSSIHYIHLRCDYFEIHQTCCVICCKRIIWIIKHAWLFDREPTLFLFSLSGRFEKRIDRAQK